MKHADEKSFNAVRKVLKTSNLSKIADDTGIHHLTLSKISDDNTPHTEVRLSVINHLKLYFNNLTEEL